MKKTHSIIVVLILVFTLVGAVVYSQYDSDDDDDEKKEDSGPFNFGEPIPNTTFYGYGNSEGAVGNPNSTDLLVGNNTPYLAKGSYFGIGTTTFEPTVGVTSTGTLFITSHNGLGEGTHIIRSKDQGKTWEDVTPNPNIVRNSNDPYLYVDPWTDRLIKFDMHALTGMSMEYSDDEGDTWATLFTKPVMGYTPQDHQTIASMPPPDGHVGSLYETIYVYSINTGIQGGGVGGSYGSFSLDGGQTWSPEEPQYELGKSPASGLSGHLVGANNGYIYRGQPAGNYDPAMYRSTDGGVTWTEHIITTETGSQTHEIAIGTDEANNVHAFWIGDDNKPYYSNSQDFGDSWRDPIMVGPEHINGTGFPTIAGGADGRAAFGYIGDTEKGKDWSGYLGVVTDGFAEKPLITTVAVNDPDDLLDTTSDCGYIRCGGFGDFIDICIDPEGRPWVGMAHNPKGEIGIMGTMIEGPSLRGELEPLPPLEAGGPSTID